MYAQQIAEHPFDPYGFEILWFQWPEPAMELLSPALFSYWLAPAVAAFGDQILLVKLWLFPFHLLLALGVHSLAERFAEGLEIPLLWMVSLSPTVLPGINLMLDVPSAALGLAGLALLARACDRNSLGLAVLAGLFAGFAIQIKYYALIGPGVMLLYALTHRRARLGLLSAGVAGCVFVGWELLLYLKYGQSHFLVQLTLQDINRTPFPRWRMALPLVTNTGVLGLAVTALGIATLTRRPTALLAFTVVAATLVVWITMGWQHALLAGVILGAAFWVTIVMVAFLAHSGGRDDESSGRAGMSRATSFLLVWLALEVVGYFVVAPFPAARRLIGLLVVSTLLCAHLYRERWPEAREIRPVILASALSITLGLALASVDLCEALSGKRAAELAAARIHEEGAPGNIWFVGHWGFQHYARAAGMRELVPDHSDVAPGDWLVLPRGIVQQSVNLDGEKFAFVDRIEVNDAVPLSTVPAYYSDALPVARRGAPRVRVTLLRATGNSRPMSAKSPQALMDWARTRSGRGALGAVPALLALAGAEEGRYVEPVKQILRDLGEPALRRATRVDDPALSAWARAELDALPVSGRPHSPLRD
jgi:hypothetical protein